MTLQALIDQLQTLAHEGHAQEEVHIDNRQNDILYNGFDIYAHSISDKDGRYVWLSFGDKQGGSV